MRIWNLNTETTSRVSYTVPRAAKSLEEILGIYTESQIKSFSGSNVCVSCY